MIDNETIRRYRVPDLSMEGKWYPQFCPRPPQTVAR